MVDPPPSHRPEPSDDRGWASALPRPRSEFVDRPGVLVGPIAGIDLPRSSKSLRRIGRRFGQGPRINATARRVLIYLRFPPILVASPTDRNARDGSPWSRRHRGSSRDRRRRRAMIVRRLESRLGHDPRGSGAPASLGAAAGRPAWDRAAGAPAPAIPGPRPGRSGQVRRAMPRPRPPRSCSTTPSHDEAPEGLGGQQRDDLDPEGRFPPRGSSRYDDLVTSSERHVLPGGRRAGSPRPRLRGLSRNSTTTAESHRGAAHRADRRHGQVEVAPVCQADQKQILVFPLPADQDPKQRNIDLGPVQFLFKMNEGRRSLKRYEVEVQLDEDSPKRPNQLSTSGSRPGSSRGRARGSGSPT